MEVEGRRFSYYVKNIQFWFFLHREIGGFRWIVTHADSGKRVLVVPTSTIAACLSDTKAAAKLELRKLLNRVGDNKVYEVLREAESLTLPKQVTT